MTLRWNDAAATVLVLAAVSLFVAGSTAGHPALIDNPRVLTGLLGLIGLASCAANNPNPKVLQHDRLAPYLGGIGGLGILVTLWGLISANPLAPYTMLAIIIGMWAVTTVRHASNMLTEEVKSWQKTHAPKNLKSAANH